MKLVSQARPNQPQCGSLTKDYPRWGWVGLARLYVSYHAYKDIWEACSGNNYYANAKMATVLIRLLLWLSRAYFRLYRIEREVLAPFLLIVLMLSTLLCSLLSYHTRDSLRKGIP